MLTYELAVKLDQLFGNSKVVCPLWVQSYSYAIYMAGNAKPPTLLSQLLCPSRLLFNECKEVNLKKRQ